MARPRARPDQVPTRERILAAAARSFAAHGLAHATLAEIAAAAGIRRPSLLYHFATKDELYEAVVRRAFDQLGRELAAAMASPAPFRERATALGLALEAFLAAHPTHAPIIVRELVNDGPGRAILVDQVAPLLDRVVVFLEQEGSHHLRPRLPLRSAVLQVVSALLLHAATPARDALWAGPVHTRALVETLFFVPVSEA